MDSFFKTRKAYATRGKVISVIMIDKKREDQKTLGSKKAKPHGFMRKNGGRRGVHMKREGS